MMATRPRHRDAGGQGVILTNRITRERLRELSAECIDFLVSVVRDANEPTKHRVASARIVVDEHRWVADREDAPANKVKFAFLAMFGGDVEKAKAWLSEHGTEMQAGFLTPPALPASQTPEQGAVRPTRRAAMPRKKKSGSVVKQNAGSHVHEMSGASHGAPLKPRRGTEAVQMKGTFVHSAHHSGITRPSDGSHGSHDGKVREHADHEHDA